MVRRARQHSLRRSTRCDAMPLKKPKETYRAWSRWCSPYTGPAERILAPLLLLREGSAGTGSAAKSQTRLPTVPQSRGSRFSMGAPETGVSPPPPRNRHLHFRSAGLRDPAVAPDVLARRLNMLILSECAVREELLKDCVCDSARRALLKRRSCPDRPMITSGRLSSLTRSRADGRAVHLTFRARRANQLPTMYDDKCLAKGQSAASRNAALSRRLGLALLRWGYGALGYHVLVCVRLPADGRLHL